MIGWHDGGRAVLVERAESPRGELVLRRAGSEGANHFEIVSNGTFLMDTRDGRSERLLVSAALQACSVPAPRVLIGGLGVGFTLAQAVRASAVSQITVVEIEPAVIAWHSTHLRPYSGGATGDPRVAIVCADLLAWLDEPGPAYDVICLDVDNGPHWTVVDANRALYGDAGLQRLASRLTPAGVLSIWSASPQPAFEARLRRRFGRVDVHRVEVARGDPDVVYLAAEPVWS